MVDPVLKWAGGKRSLISRIISLFPIDFKKRVYHEPFFGGGAIFFHIGPKMATINDINKDIMNFYTVVRDNPAKLIELAKEYKYQKEKYYELRSRYNYDKLDNIEKASILLYLNKTAYNGLYRVNSQGHFNVPFGRYNNPTIVNENKIYEASELLQKVKIYSKDFGYVLYAEEGDLVYFDPPYQPISSTSNFTSYYSDGFTLTDQKRLRDACKYLDNKGIFFVLSNSASKIILDLYRDIESFKIEYVKVRRAISSKASTRGPINEVLIYNVPENMIIKNNRFRY
jgi:DNA adenine methylase